MNNNDAGEVELLLSDASAVEQKVIDVLIKVFGKQSALNGGGWLMSNLLLDPNALNSLNVYIDKRIDIKLNRRSKEYK